MHNFYPLLNEANIRNLGDLDTVVGPGGVVIDMKALKKDIEEIRSLIVVQDPLFAPFVYDLNIVYTWGVKTMATDGSWIFINPAWTSILTFDECAFVIYHELCHCLLDHMKRVKFGNYNSEKFNRAADYEINAILVDILDDYDDNVMKGNLRGLYNKEYLGMSAETIYDIIPNEAGDKSSKNNPGDCESGKCQNDGDVEDGQGDGQEGDQENGQDTQNDKKENKKYEASKLGNPTKDDARLQRETSKEAGETPGGLISPELGKKLAENAGINPGDIAENTKTKEDWNKKSKELLNRALRQLGSSKSGKGSALTTILGNYHNSAVNWKNILSRYVGDLLSRTDTKWTMPNRKYMAASPNSIRIRQKEYGREIDKILVCIDTSGSMNEDLLNAVMNEVSSICFAQKADEVEILLFHTSVYKSYLLKKGKPLPKIDVDSGGTDFQSVLDYIKEKYKNNVSLCIFFTDGLDAIPVKPSYHDVFVWVIYDNPNWPNSSYTGSNPAFGKRILVTSQEVERGVKKFVGESFNTVRKLVSESIKWYIR